MNRLIICFAAIFVASIGLAQDKTQLKDQKDKASYSIGHDIGSTFKKQNIELNLDAMVAGMKDALSGKEPRLVDVREVQNTLIGQNANLDLDRSNSFKAA